MLDSPKHLALLDRLAKQLIKEPMLPGEWAGEMMLARLVSAGRKTARRVC